MPTVDEIIGRYREAEQQIAAIDAEAAAKTAPLKKQLEVMEKWISAKSLQDGWESQRTKHGTVYFAPTARCSVADWDSMLAFVRGNSAWDLLTHAANKQAVTQYLGEHNALPPGVNYTVVRTMHLRKPSVKE